MARHIFRRVKGKLVDATADPAGLLPHGNDGPPVTKKGPKGHKKTAKVIDGSQPLEPQLHPPSEPDSTPADGTTEPADAPKDSSEEKSEEKPDAVSDEKTPDVPGAQPTGLTPEKRDAIFAEIDGMTVDEAEKAIQKVTDLTLLDRIRDNARYVTTRRNADARIQALKEA